jgi:hypothetical protein
MEIVFVKFGPLKRTKMINHTKLLTAELDVVVQVKYPDGPNP